MRIGNRKFDTDTHTYIMGILNVTPDSFSDGGRYVTLEKALKRAEQMIQEGAHIIDIGGESTRPGYTRLTDEAEMERVLPVIEKIKNNFDIPISLDTYKAAVAEEGILAGADMINDIWGLKYDHRMAEIIAENGVACCLMHNRQEPVYTDFLADVLGDLEQSLKLAEATGISREKLLIDPGVGFAKTYEHNLLIMKHLEKLHSLGLPIMLAASRKSVIGQTLKLEKDERVEGTLATSVLAVMKGCSFVRVHDIKENERAVRMALAIRNV